MSSTFFGLNIATSGMRAANAALNTTANNIANSDTDGFSRQQVVTQAADAIRTFTTYGCVGAGVETLSIERVRDSFYDDKYRANESKLGEQERKAYYMAIMEDYLSDDGNTGFASIFDDMCTALQEVMKNPGSDSTKASYISSMKTLTDYFNNMAGDLEDLQGDINEEIKTQVYAINSISQEIATLNKQINVIEMTGSIANELRDKRDGLIDELSSYVTVTTSETPICDTKGNETGATRFMVKIAGGELLVDQNDYNQLTCKARESYEKVNQTDIDGLYDVYWTNDDGSCGEQFRLDNGSLGGSLKALADLRDGNNGEYFYGIAKDTGTVVQTDKKGNTYLAKTVTIATTADYLRSMNKCNLSDSGGTISIANTIYYYSSWSFDESSGEYTFVLDNEHTDPIAMAGLNTKIGTEAAIGNANEYQGIPYYMEQMNEWIRDYAAKLNSIFAGTYNEDGSFSVAGYTSADSEAGIMVLTGNESTGTGQYSLDKLCKQDADDVSGKGYYYLTAANFSVNDALLLDAAKLGVKSDASAGIDECETATLAYRMMFDKSEFSFRGNTAGGFLESLISDVALNASNANTFTDSYTSMQTLISNQRTSISGVDQDEEAVNLVKFQNSYSLAAKVVQVMQEIYEKLINDTGV